MTDYTPEPEKIKQDLHYIREYWTPRNQFIEKAREHNNGRNAIAAPVNVRFKIKPIHVGALATMVNEKVSRFLFLPKFQAVPNSIDPEERERTSRIERWLKAAQYEMERVSDGDVWGRLILDCILIDGGVERIDRAPQHFWPELVNLETTPSALKDETRTNYKKEHGTTLRSTYVPLEYTFPVYDGSVITHNYEYEQRSLASVIRAFPEEGRQLSHLQEDRKHKDIILVHCTDSLYHSIYAVDPSSGGYTNQQRNDRENVWLTSNGELVYLYSYKHNLKRVPYNYVAGRLGGWKTAEGGMLDVGKIILHHNEVLDELGTQIYTNIRATKWPSYKFFVDPEKRGFQEKGPPQAPKMGEGEDITMYVGEDLLPLVEPTEDPVTGWFFGMIQGQMGKLGGNPVLFGENQPGVRTGYQQALQISEAESVDAKLEQHLVQGAITRGTLMMLHARELNEELFAHLTTKGADGRKHGEYISLKPEDLHPIPRLDASVRAPRPVDFLAGLRASREASDDRGGKGPLLSDDTIREEILARDEPDEEYKKILIEKAKTDVIASGVIAQRVGDALNIRLAQNAGPELPPNAAANVDPALLQAIQAVVGQSVGRGGVNPQTLNQTTASGNGILTPGGVPTDSQPEQRLGEDVNASQAANL